MTYDGKIIDSNDFNMIMFNNENMEYFVKSYLELTEVLQYETEFGR